jgi:hypothetical protein
MKKIIKAITLKLFVLGLLAAPLAFSGAGAVVSAEEPNIQKNLCGGADNLQFGETSNCASLEQDATDNVNDLVTDIINIFSVVVGIVAVIMIIIGGFRYIVSGGDSGNVTNAKNTILYALIGLVIVALAQFIVRFVLGKTSEI